MDVHSDTGVDKGGSRVGERGRGRGAAGAEGGGVWGGGVEIFLNFYPKTAHFCAFCNLQQ